MSERPEAVQRMFDGVSASAKGEWRGDELWQVVTLEAPAFEGVKVKIEYCADVPPRPAIDPLDDDDDAGGG